MIPGCPSTILNQPLINLPFNSLEGLIPFSQNSNYTDDMFPVRTECRKFKASLCMSSLAQFHEN